MKMKKKKMIVKSMFQYTKMMQQVLPLVPCVMIIKVLSVQITNLVVYWLQLLLEKLTSTDQNVTELILEEKK